MRSKVGLPACALGSVVDPRRASDAAGGRRLSGQHHSVISRTSPSRCPSRTRRDGGHRAPATDLTRRPVGVWRRLLAVGAAAAVAVALWVVVLVGFPSFPGGGAHLPALGPSSPRPSPSALASPGPQPGGQASKPQAQGPPGSARLTSAGNGGDEVEDEPPDVEDEPPTSSSGGTGAPTPGPRVG